MASCPRAAIGTAGGTAGTLALQAAEKSHGCSEGINEADGTSPRRAKGHMRAGGTCLPHVPLQPPPWQVRVHMHPGSALPRRQRLCSARPPLAGAAVLHPFLCWPSLPTWRNMRSLSWATSSSSRSALLQSSRAGDARWGRG